MKKRIKQLGIVLLIALVGIQVIRPEGNASAVNPNNTVGHAVWVPANVDTLLRAACYDCHSNNTKPMWYMNVQPMGMWIDHHIEEAKGELNFDEFATYDLKKQHHKMEEVGEVIQEGEMPLSSYTWMHSEAKLSDAQKKLLMDWSKAVMDSLATQLPAEAGGEGEHEEGEEH